MTHGNVESARLSRLAADALSLSRGWKSINPVEKVSNLMKMLATADQIRYPRMSTGELRAAFLITGLFRPGHIDLVYTDQDRAIVGSAVPLETPLTLPTDDALRAAYFTERRELGILNIGGAGSVEADGATFDLGPLDALYLGRGTREIAFLSRDSQHPAEYYLLSYPAHGSWPAGLVRSSAIAPVELGSPAQANHRFITKLIYEAGVRSCQLVMGFTRLAPGSIWNTMPPHTHMRRSEIYLYFNLAEGERVMHLMGPAHETRHLVIANKQVVISPGWSIHAGAGTSNYSFCWGMGGENQVYDDMDKLAIAELL